MNTARASSTNFRTIYSFRDANDGGFPVSPLLVVGHALYGTAGNGGKACSATCGYGTVFRVTPRGDLTTIYRFANLPDGAYPGSQLLYFKGFLYGVTIGGGLNHARCLDHGCGTIYRVSLAGKFRMLYRFRGGTDGDWPQGLVLLNDRLYGVTQYGGAHGHGTVFSVTLAGKKQTLHSFYGGRDGASPRGGLAVLNGLLYGVTYDGGSPCGCGTVFSISPRGNEHIVHTFAPATYPAAALVAYQGLLYGTSPKGKFYFDGGSVYSISPSGVVVTLHQFSLKDGFDPQVPVTIYRGRIYGTAASDGGERCDVKGVGCGTAFSLSLSGQSFTTLHRFITRDEVFPSALTGFKGKLYGVTNNGGDLSLCGHAGCGAIFQITP